MNIGKIKVTLGGSITDRVLSILTGYLLTDGQLIIHNLLKKIIKNKVDDFNKKF
jgi:hypothetical protein